MATLILSTVGGAFAGPVGNAIGALIGQAIDQELFAPTRRGPRVGDLAVQTSSYGTLLPRVYGSMRVAGSVIWSTDLIEHSGSSGGAKGQPDVTYSYTISFAVALSSRAASAIGRIWADGKLLRGAAGDLKVGGKLRFYDGGEDQAVDPLIASVEGIAATPAYRGLALAVFEDLELAEFGNRMPFLTIELIGDATAPAIGSILVDASRGAIAADPSSSVVGYAAYGRTIRDAVQPLVDSFAVHLFDDGEVLRGPTSTAAQPIGSDEYGNSADQRQTPLFEREQASVRMLPATLRLSYYDPARDYQSGEARAVAGELNGSELQQELPAALEASVGKALAQGILARSWAGRDTLTLRLPPSRLPVEPGTTITLPLSPSVWNVQEITIDSFVVVATLRPVSNVEATVAADAGRVASNPDVVAAPLDLAILDVPNVFGSASTGPAILLAASSTSEGWRSAAVEISFAGQEISSQTARRKSILGFATSLLARADSDLVDEQSTVDVSLDDGSQWLTSCDNSGLAAGQNLALIGNELIQFARAAPLGARKFRLGRLLRGRGGTEWACANHVAGEGFCLLDSGSLQAVALPTWSIGADVTTTDSTGQSSTIRFAGESVRPISPVNLAALKDPSDNLLVDWTRRSRLGFAWVDEIDAPLGESVERYAITLTGSASTVELTSDQPSVLVSAAVVATLGAGSVAVDVQQIGDFAASRRAKIYLNLP